MRRRAFFLLLLFALVDLESQIAWCDSVCSYFPNYPQTQVSYTTCANGCCGGTYPTTASSACCASSNFTWIAIPITIVVVLITCSIVWAFVCIKCQKSPRFVRRIDVAPSMVQAYPSGYMDPYYQNVSYITGNVQWQIAPPPRYEDLEMKPTPSDELGFKNGSNTAPRVAQPDSDASQDLPNYTNIKK